MKRTILLLLIMVTVFAVSVSAEAGFTNQVLEVDYKNGAILVSGSFDTDICIGQKYKVLLAAYTTEGRFEKAQLSENFIISEGSNSFGFTFDMLRDELSVRAFVFTEDLRPICMDVRSNVSVEYLDWAPSDTAFYYALADKGITKKTDFEKLFEENASVTVAEAIAIASNLHAGYRASEVPDNGAEPEAYIEDFDDPSIIVDLTDRNSRNDSGVSFNHATGEITDDGVLVVTPDGPNSNGVYDPGVLIEGLDLNSKHYNKITFRMKRDALPNVNDAARKETVEIFFKTSSSPSITGDKCIYADISKIDPLTDWFEVEVEAGSHKYWSDYITGIRFDPTNNNGVYYIDYIKFSKSDKYDYSEWYDKYVDYAVENGIIAEKQYSEAEYGESITREEFSNLLVSAFDEEYFSAINSIDGIPDVEKNDKYSEIKLLLYNAGVMLGKDDAGSFCGDNEVARSEAAAVINRAIVPENRLSAYYSAVWESDDYKHDIEFSDDSWLTILGYEAETLEIADGRLYLKAKERTNSTLKYDPKIINKSTSIVAEEYTKLRVRMKPVFDGEVTSTKYDFFFMTENDTGFTETNSFHQDFSEYGYIDPAGWYVLEIDFRLHTNWKGNITGYRFDPANTGGTYIIDYIRFVRSDYYDVYTDEELKAAGYTATRLMQDEGFERGFYVAKVDQTAGYLNHGIWQDYCTTNEKPLWGIGPWWSLYDLYENRDTTTDKYTLADTYGINTITYNPEEKSVSMRLNATNIYNGEPHIDEEYTWWPHLLLEQTSSICSFDKVRNSAAADRMFVELDIRMTDFKDTTNTEGTNVCSYLIYFYLMTDKAPGQKIWFGMTVFNGLNARTNVTPGWSPDSAAHQYMYGMPQAVVFDGIENSFNTEAGVAVVGDEWKHIRLDVTPHIDRAVEWANRDNIFGVKVTKEDMYFSGVNIGYEIHGNYDATFEFKNFNMVSYDKAE